MFPEGTDGFDGIFASTNSQISKAYDALESDASLDLTNPNNAEQAQQDAATYQTLMQDQSSFISLVKGINLSIAKSIGQ